MIPIDDITFISNISKTIGVPIDQVYTMLIVFLGIPFSIINYLILSPKLRIMYSLIIGLIMQFLVYELGTINIIITSIITYIFVLKYGRKKSGYYIFYFILFNKSSFISFNILLWKMGYKRSNKYLYDDCM